MANGPLSPEELSQKDLLNILNQSRKNSPPKFLPDVMEGTTGNSFYDFLGQAAWKAIDEAVVGSLGVSDAISESIKGDAANTWEEMIAGDAAGSWEELSDMGKAGYSVGAAIGQIPSFMAGGFLTSTAVKAAGIIPKFAAVRASDF